MNASGAYPKRSMNVGFFTPRPTLTNQRGEPADGRVGSDPVGGMLPARARTGDGQPRHEPVGAVEPRRRADGGDPRPGGSITVHGYVARRGRRVVLGIRIGRPGNHRQVPIAAVPTAAEMDRGVGEAIAFSPGPSGRRRCRYRSCYAIRNQGATAGRRPVAWCRNAVHRQSRRFPTPYFAGRRGIRRALLRQGPSCQNRNRIQRPDR